MKFAVELDQKRPIVPCMFTSGSTEIPNAMALAAEVSAHPIKSGAWRTDEEEAEWFMQNRLDGRNGSVSGFLGVQCKLCGNSILIKIMNCACCYWWAYDPRSQPYRGG